VDYQFDLSNRHLKAGPMALDDLHFGLRVHGLDLNVLTTKRATTSPANRHWCHCLKR
jgi:hypothetical protein